MDEYVRTIAGVLRSSPLSKAELPFSWDAVVRPRPKALTADERRERNALTRQAQAEEIKQSAQKRR